MERNRKIFLASAGLPPGGKITKTDPFGSSRSGCFGNAFRSETKTADKKNLLIFITPTILQDGDFHPTTTEFLNAKAEKLPPNLNPNSLWDTTKPYNWADPENTDPSQKVLKQPATR